MSYYRLPKFRKIRMGLLHDSALSDGPNRWRILLLSCFIVWGQYFCYDIPAVLHDQFEETSHMSSSDFSWYFNSLYSAYSLPNLFLPLVFGWFSDRTSGTSLLIILSLLVVVGQGLLMLGVWKQLPYVSVSGRLLFGVGCESLGVGLSAIVTHYFFSRETAFALASVVSVGRLGMNLLL